MIYSGYTRFLHVLAIKQNKIKE